MARIIVVERERQGYRCSRCGTFHKDDDPLFGEHVGYGRELTYWRQTRGWVILADGTSVPMPADEARWALGNAK